MKTLPALTYVGDEIVGVVSDCDCPTITYPADSGLVMTADHPHESHDIVPPRFDRDLPPGVDFEDYKRWCRMFAVAPKLLDSCKAMLHILTGAKVDTSISLASMYFDRVVSDAIDVVASAEGR